MAYTVDGELCVACGFCVGHCPEVFAFNAAGVAEAVDTATGEAAGRAAEAMENCPTAAISQT